MFSILVNSIHPLGMAVHIPEAVEMGRIVSEVGEIGGCTVIFSGRGPRPFGLYRRWNDPDASVYFNMREAVIAAKRRGD